jgi:hypothetical protein
MMGGAILQGQQQMNERRKEVWTARISTRDPDAFNVTRKSGDPYFAPSWPLFLAMRAIRKTGREPTYDEWRIYAKTYLKEMQLSYERFPAPWEALRARQRVVLTCYCVNLERCHRKLLARILERLGASYMGEIPEILMEGTQEMFWALEEDET